MRTSSILIALLLAPLALAARPDAETQRLYTEMDTLAAKSAWAGVERGYQQLVTQGLPVDQAHLLLAAEAARSQGDMLTTIQRLLEAESLDRNADVSARVADVTLAFGRVQLASRSGTLAPTVAPFRPDAQAATAFAQQSLTESGTFDGFLGVGTYTLGDKTFEVQAEAPLLVVSTEPIGVNLWDLTLAGVSFPRRLTVGGAKLQLNGMGVRSKVGINVYVGALYLPEPTKDSALAIQQDRPKRLVMEFVFRKVSQTAVVDHFRQDFAHVPGADQLQPQIERFLQVMEDVEKGDQLVFDYLPWKGTLVTVKGKKRLTVPGKEFMQALFTLYLGEHPPTKSLRDGLMGRYEP